jgi:hypothetical protein
MTGCSKSRRLRISGQEVPAAVKEPTSLGPAQVQRNLLAETSALLADPPTSAIGSMPARTAAKWKIYRFREINRFSESPKPER